MDSRPRTLRRRTGRRWAAVVAVALAGAAAAPAWLPTAWADRTPPPSAGNAPSDPQELRVMTRNIYLGASLTPALTARDTPGLLAAVSAIYAGVRATDFAVRAEGLADEIQAAQPGLVGLQEVTTWTTTGPGAGPSQDFLAILQQALDRRGLRYSVASVTAGTDVGPIPLTAPCASPTVGACTIRLQDRDVVLVNERTPGLRWSTPRNGTYRARLAVPLPGVPPVQLVHGWASVEATHHGAPFRFVTTHLETQQAPDVQEAQAVEFLNGPVSGADTVIAVGDFNSAADGTTTGTYRLLTGRFRDAWAATSPAADGFTCCQEPTLSGTAGQLASRIDLVLLTGPVSARHARVVGAQPFRDAPPRYTSDHAGVVAGVRWERPAGAGPTP
ncbi:endonuclease/exonuclease/phosphatase family protein [Virgisporangium ochraceum]|uniref:Endonuclease/exonuclease/phosphatase domain-containing protein n=1 Tax=Virgisporangium ochraceum TaxID=65505 RepID=A0A8J3ZWK8_9ACTN|nr:endonuclease/exonuclease/phosphatase family protein [Virgisporangium ochraceum]GIJ71447.1 hypothetical protein Voc01_063640 [Virgisporangium ochraceum]